MADLTYRVAVDTAQAQQNINSLKSALGGLAAAFSVRATVQFADSITNIQNRLRTLSPNADTVNKQFAAIVQIADQSRAPLGAVGDLFFRIARSADQLGISQREAAQITDTLAKGLVSSGLSAQEAAGPLLQLGQALQSGRFQGDELRSILEGLPIVAKALADEMGVPIGRLRQLGAEGRITGEVFVAAMMRARDGINEAFGRTIPTVGQSLERLQTNLARLFSEFEANTGTFAALADAVGKLADAMGPLGRFIKENGDGLATLGKIVAGVAAAYLLFGKALPAIVTAQDKIINSIKAGATVFTFLKNQLIGVISAVERFALNILRGFGVLSSSLPALGSFTAALGALAKGLLRFAGFAGLFYSIAEAIDYLFRKLDINISILGSLGKAWDWIKEKITGSNGVVQGYQSQVRAVDNAIDALDNEVRKTKEAAQATATQIYEVERLKQAYIDQVREQENSIRTQNQLIGLGELQQNMVNNLQTSYNNYLTQRKALEKEILDATLKGTDEELAKIPLLNRALEDLNARYEINLQTIRDLTIEQERLTRARVFEQFAIKQQQEAADQLKKIQRELRDQGLSEIERKYREIEDAAEDSALAAIRAEEARRGGIKLSSEEMAEFRRIANESTEELKRKTQELYESGRSFSTGWGKAFREYADNATNAAKQAERIFQRVTQSMEDAIVNFAKTGRFEWRNFINGILEDLLRSQIQQVIAQVFSIGQTNRSNGGGLSGGLFGGRIIPGILAEGGPVSSRRPYIVGEKGPELFIPDSEGQMMPNARLGGSTNITYNINAVDAVSFQALVARDPAFIYSVSQQGARTISGRR